MKLKRIDWLKIDVEGAEIEVLEGVKKYLKRRRVLNIIIESSKGSVLLNLLKNYGFSIKQIYENYYLAYQMPKGIIVLMKKLII